MILQAEYFGLFALLVLIPEPVPEPPNLWAAHIAHRLSNVTLKTNSIKQKAA
jgi:hypothetical protein